MADTASAGGGPEADLAFGHYRVLRRSDGTVWELGRGAMGVTYKAYDERLRVEVALKVITPGQVDDPKSQALFLREARAAARVRHPNVATVVYLNDAPGNIFYAMEFVPGESLAEFLRSNGALPPDVALGFAIQVARGLGAIHEQHIVHRDLKPANLMIVPATSATTESDGRQIKIIDFGLARGFGVEGLGTTVEAQTIGFRGTTLYASPEQCEEQRALDGRSDQYSLGCILWEMLTGSPPYQGRNHRELLNQHVAKPLPLDRIAQLPAGAQALLTRMLAKDPADRFPDSPALIAALERCRSRLTTNQDDYAEAGGTTALPSAAESPAAKRRRWMPAAVAAVAALLAVMIWFSILDRDHPKVAVTSVAAPPANSSVAMAPAPEPAAMPRKTIAVLPFENLSGRPEDSYLADGLQEEILNALARVRDLKVISRTSVMEYRGKARNIREIGQRLGAGSILEGSVRREGNTLRLTVQLIDASNDQHLFATSYDRELNKVLDLQSAVARQVADALAATLTRQERGDFDRVATNSGDAYDRYLRAVAIYRQPLPEDDLGLVAPKRLLEEAVRYDPDYADAYALLSQANTLLSYLHGQTECAPAAKLALEEAFAKDSKSPEALLARGLYSMYVTKNLDHALADLKAVVNLRPNSSEALVSLGSALRRSGQMDEALAYFKRAWDLDPLNQAYSGGAITTLLGLRRYQDAIKQTEVYTARFPNDAGSYFGRAHILARIQGSSEPMKAALRDHGKLLGPDESKRFEARIALLDGRYSDAVQILSNLPDADDSAELRMNIACLYHAAGDKERAEQEFRRAEARVLELQQSAPATELSLEKLTTLALAQSMLGKHEAALATADLACTRFPERIDATNGPAASHMRSVVLVRAGRTEEGYAEVKRLMHVPFGAPISIFDDSDFISLLTKGDPQFDELNYRAPRL